MSIKALDSLIGNGDMYYDAVLKHDNIFMVECIDALLPISNQLKKIKEHIDKYKKIVGIKIYLGYQPVFANDKRFFPVFDFADRNKLSVVFHCGVGAENLSDIKELNYSLCLPVSQIAQAYPSVNFIVSHFNYPNFEDCAKLISCYPNIYTDISGTYENYDKSPYRPMIENFVWQLKPILKKYKGLDKKIMFGTDFFGEGSGFGAVQEYVKTCEMLFDGENLDDLLFKNCLNAYPHVKFLIENNKTSLWYCCL